EERQVRAIETIYNEMVLQEVAQFTVIALVALFLVSLFVGWVMSGRALKPIDDIASVATEIQASDLSRRIDLIGPDDELTRLARTFDDMLERLERAFQSQRDFLADTSHDLRTPLAVMQSNVELVSADPKATVEDWRRAGEIVKRNVEKMAVMIEGLLAAARLQIGRAEAVAVDLASLVEAKAAEFRPAATDVDVHLSTTTEAVTARGVEVSLDRALTNLVDNAIKVAPARSTVVLGCGRAHGWLWLGVGDEGPGLPGETPSAAGGLGLSIVAQIAEAHGGRLSAYPVDRNGGTHMIVWLPDDASDGQPPDESPLG
ncbi:MAG: HAMP domain-containing protein, partial [Acidimicrobiia bacterium]|nr:HAMP domain-containing protein [Acidimicrobiia bacterium]